jgi:outer membrane protein assembly factor BamD (BamD/ComL family)
MGRARASLGQGDAARALSLLSEHAKKFPRGVLAPERDVSRIMALCALGRTEKAKQHAATFVRRHPRSALTDRVRRTCVGDDLP